MGDYECDGLRAKLSADASFGIDSDNWSHRFSCTATSQNAVVHERRQRAAAAFRDGILLFHASSELDLTADGFRQDPFFYYFTGLGNTVGAVLAIDGNRAKVGFSCRPNHRS